MAIFGGKTEKSSEPAAAETKSDAPAVAVVNSGALKNILVMPRISEKARILSEGGKYVFKIVKKANKVEIRKAIEAAYKVKVTQVNIINMLGKKRNYGRASGQTSNFKKAIVTLKKGQKIDTAEVA